MTRISDAALQQILLQGFSRAQESAQANQIRISTGKISDRYSGVGASTTALLSAEGVLARAGAWEGAAKTALARLQTQETALGGVSAALADLRAGLIRTLASGGAETLGVDVEGAAQRALASLNASFGGTYVFGGTDGGRAPVAAATLEDLASADPATLFQIGERTRLPVEAGVDVDGGPTADEAGGAAIDIFRAFAAADAAIGPFAGELTEAQRAFLVEQVAAIDAALGGLSELQSVNAVAQGQADQAIQRNRQQRDLAEIVAADIEDADIAEAIARLNQDRIAIEASARALATASELSLLNFL